MTLHSLLADEASVRKCHPRNASEKRAKHTHSVQYLVTAVYSGVSLDMNCLSLNDGLGTTFELFARVSVCVCVCVCFMNQCVCVCVCSEAIGISIYTIHLMIAVTNQRTFSR